MAPNAVARVGLRDVTNNIQANPGLKQVLGKNVPGQTQKQPAAVQVPALVQQRINQQATQPSQQFHHSQSQQPATTSQHPVSNPQECEEYAPAIYQYLRESENNLRLRVTDPNFLDRQDEISSRMRGILLDWLVEVHYKFKLSPETLYLCINLIDRLLERDRTIPRRKLQLLGGTCMLIASKYEEFRPPEVGDICYIMDNAYSRDDILAMEVKVLNTLKFEVTVPSALQFLECYIKKLGIPREDRGVPNDFFMLAQYLLEATLLETRFLKYKPSELAAAAFYLANRIRKTHTPFWPDVLADLTGLKEIDEVKPLAKDIFEILPQYKTKSLFKKYSMDKYRQVAPTIPSQ